MAKILRGVIMKLKPVKWKQFTFKLTLYDRNGLEERFINGEIYKNGKYLTNETFEGYTKKEVIDKLKDIALHYYYY